MENIEIDNSENLLCPYCQKLLIDKESDPDYTTCEHVIFIATDYGFEFIREDMSKLIDKKKSGINYDSYTANLPIDGIRIADYPPPPACLGVYWGFMDK
jgi:hypothetical protein